jgi:hypothetical protein
MSLVSVPAVASPLFWPIIIASFTFVAVLLAKTLLPINTASVIVPVNGFATSLPIDTTELAEVIASRLVLPIATLKVPVVILLKVLKPNATFPTEFDLVPVRASKEFFPRAILFAPSVKAFSVSVPIATLFVP